MHVIGRGKRYICTDCIVDDDNDGKWEPLKTNVFEAIASCTKPLTTEERIELGIL